MQVALTESRCLKRRMYADRGRNASVAVFALDAISAMADHLTNPIHPTESIPPRPIDPPGAVPPVQPSAADTPSSALQRSASTVMSTRRNGIIDYAIAAALIVAPSVLGFSDHAVTPVARTLGAVLLFYSLCTKYELGVVRMIPLQVHLMLDLGMAGLLAAAPIHFAIWGLPGMLFVLLGVVMGVSALMTRHGHKFTRPDVIRSQAEHGVRSRVP